MDDQQRACELLALGLDEYGHHAEAANVRGGIDLDVYRIELWSITAALRAAPECPEGFVMVPVDLGLARDVWKAGIRVREANGSIADIWAAMIAARPQGVKDV